MTAVSVVRDFENKAASSQRETERLEICFQQSAQIEREHAAREQARKMFRAEVNSLVAEAVQAFGEYAIWRDELEFNWSKRPDTYQSDVHMQVRSIGDRWHILHRKIIRFVDVLESEGIECDKAPILRRNLRTMASIEMMDSTEELPAPIVDMAREAMSKPKGS